MVSAALSLSWRIEEMTQRDVQCVTRLDSATPDVRLVFGISHKFRTGDPAKGRAAKIS
jgi:hypothetical protein